MAVTDGHAVAGHDDADSIAGGVDLARLNEHIVPVTAGNAVVTGLEGAAANDGILRAADVNSIPAFGDGNILKDRVFQGISQKGIIGGTGNVHILHPEPGCLRNNNGMRAPHAFLSARIEHMTPVNGTRADDSSIGHPIPDDKRLHPLPVVHAVGIDGAVAAVVAREVVLRNIGFIGVVGVQALQDGTVREEQLHAVPKVEGGRLICPGRNHHAASAGFGALVHGLLNGLGAYLAFKCPKIGNIENTFLLRCAGNCGKKDKEWKKSFHDVQRYAFPDNPVKDNLTNFATCTASSFI